MIAVECFQPILVLNWERCAGSRVSKGGIRTAATPPFVQSKGRPSEDVGGLRRTTCPSRSQISRASTHSGESRREYGSGRCGAISHGQRGIRGFREHKFGSSAALGGHVSVESSELSFEDWTRWQGHVINQTFPLGRHLGSSDHSGVFLTRSGKYGTSEIAIKLIPADRALAEIQLPRWKRAGNLVSPHLLRMFEWGGCQLEGLPYLYIVMEYADQTLAQLLQHRALTDEEAREMLPPILDGLAFLHGRNLVHGSLKPANILVVGDQLKLASDTIRRVGEGSIGGRTGAEPPEDRQEGGSAAADIRALGLTLFEALSRRSPSGLDGSGMLPADFSVALRDVVSRCLSPDAQDRPTVADLLAWAGRPSPESAPVGPMPATPEPGARSPSTPRPTPPKSDVAEPQPVPSTEVRKSRGVFVWMLWAAVAVALVWTGSHLTRSLRGPTLPAAPVQPPAGSLPQTSGGGSPASLPAAPPVSSLTKPARSGNTTPFAALHEVIPEVAPGARHTIRGHIKVWVRVVVEPDGSASGAAADRAGPSSYFERIAVEAARKWTFPPTDTTTKRLVQVRFDFSREDTTARAVLLR